MGVPINLGIPISSLRNNGLTCNDVAYETRFGSDSISLSESIGIIVNEDVFSPKC